MTDLLKYYPEAEKLLRHLLDTFTPSAIVPLYFQGATAAAEFLTYAADKLYLCLDSWYSSAGGANVAPITVTLHSSTNAVFGYINSQTSMWNTTGAAVNYVPITLHYRNYYFSRIQIAGITYMKFNGYKITY
jgi:hypothetical protein